MTEMIVEYLAIAEEAQEFCKNIEGFKELIRQAGSIGLKGNEIRFANGFNCQYYITFDDVLGSGQPYFHIKFIKALPANLPEALVEDFSKSLASTVKIISKAGAQVTTLRDDISQYYSVQSYPIVYEIENLMRRLIRHFMDCTPEVRQRVRVVYSERETTDYEPQTTHLYQRLQAASPA